MKKNTLIIDIDGQVRENPDFPVAVVREQESEHAADLIIDPILNWSLTNNLYGRIFTLIEATTESYKLKAVKDLFSKEIKQWESDVYESAREIATGGSSSRNLYTRDQYKINS